MWGKIINSRVKKNRINDELLRQYYVMLRKSMITSIKKEISGQGSVC